MHPGEGDEEIEFRAAIVEVITRALVALKHELAELREVAVAQDARARRHALVLPDDMIGALILAFGEPLAVAAQERAVHGAERFDTQRTGGGFALASEFVVSTIDERVLHTGIANHERDLADHRQVFDRERLAIDLDRVKGFSKERRKGIEQSAVDAHEVGFRRVTGPGDLDFLGVGQRRKRSEAGALWRNRDTGCRHRVGMKLPDGERGCDD